MESGTLIYTTVNCEMPHCELFTSCTEDSSSWAFFRFSAAASQVSPLKLALINKRVEVRLSWDTCVSKPVNIQEMENPKICF